MATMSNVYMCILFMDKERWLYWLVGEKCLPAKAVWSRFNTLRGDFGLQDRLMRTIAAAQSSMTRSSVLFSIFCSRLIKLQARLLMLLLKVAVVEVTGLKTPLEDADVMEEVGASHEALARDDDDPPCSSSWSLGLRFRRTLHVSEEKKGEWLMVRWLIEWEKKKKIYKNKRNDKMNRQLSSKTSKSEKVKERGKWEERRS